tara:strand:+ start:180 stop:407 length:228 start_codon:yes stop_codon:yes gene_type:complete
MNLHIQWVYGGDNGYWRSAEGRFEISPIFIGRTTPQMYRVEDNLLKTSTSMDLCSQAKKWALRTVEKEAQEFAGK